MLSGWQRSKFSWAKPENFYADFYRYSTGRSELMSMDLDEFDIALQQKNPAYEFSSCHVGYKNLNYNALVIEVGLKQDEADFEQQSFRYQSLYLTHQREGTSLYDITLYLRASSFTFTTLLNECDKIKFSHGEFFVNKHSYLIAIVIRENQTLYTFNKIKQLLENINRHQSHVEFSPDFIEELSQWCQNPYQFKARKKDFKNISQLNTPIRSYVNPFKPPSTFISDLITFYKNVPDYECKIPKEIEVILPELKAGKFPYSKVQKELISGADPNQDSETGKTPLTALISLSENFEDDLLEKLILLLLAYGANPFQRCGNSVCYTSAYDAARCLKKDKILDKIIVAGTSPEKRHINKSHFLVEIGGNEICVITRFHDSYNTYVITKNLDLLSAFEKISLYQLYLQGFNPTEAEFKRNFVGENRSVDLIFMNNKLVGFNLYHKYNESDSKIVAYLNSFMLPDYAGTNIMTLLWYRQCFCEPLLNPENIVACFFSAMTYGAYRPFQNTLHFPKHDPSAVNPAATIPIDQIAKAGCGCEVQYDGEYPFIKEDEVTLSARSVALKQPNILREFFEKVLLNNQSNRGVTVFFYASMQFFIDAKNAVGATWGIDFFKHCYELAKLLGSPYHKTPVNFPAYKDINTLFWNKGKTNNTCIDTYPLFHIKARI